MNHRLLNLSPCASLKPWIPTNTHLCSPVSKERRLSKIMKTRVRKRTTHHSNKFLTSSSWRDNQVLAKGSHLPNISHSANLRPCRDPKMLSTIHGLIQCSKWRMRQWTMRTKTLSVLGSVAQYLTQLMLLRLVTQTPLVLIGANKPWLGDILGLLPPTKRCKIIISITHRGSLLVVVEIPQGLAMQQPRAQKTWEVEVRQELVTT